MKPDDAFDLLKHSHASGRLAQAYILAGPPQGEAAELAIRILTAIFCETGSGEACGKCSACRQVAGRTHVDILWVEPQMKSRRISIDQVRELQRRVFQTPYAGDHKACVLVAADRLGPEAANAFLKTLEEPPGNSLFLLLTDSPESLLPTVRSRCQQLAVIGEDPELPEEWREPVLQALASLSGGKSEIAALARAEQIADVLKRMKTAARDEERDAAGESEAEEERATVEARANARYRLTRSLLMRSVLFWYRDLFLLVNGVDEDGVRYSERLPELRKAIQGLTYRQAFRNIEVVTEMDRQMEQNITEGSVLSWGFGILT